MGKREILLIAAFLLMGLVVYQFTAPDDPSKAGFSVSGIIDDIKSEIHRPRHSAESTVAGATPVAAGVEVLDVPEFRGALTIVGEATRETIEAELRTAVWTDNADESNRRVKDVAPVFETRGDTIEVRVATPDDVPRIRRELTLRVPARLRVRAQVASGSTEIRGVAAVWLDGRGEAAISEIAGAVEGEYQDGEIGITKADSVRLTLRRCDTALAGIKGGTVLEASDGEVGIREASGEVRLTTIRTDVTVSDAAGALHLNASDGRATIDAPGGPVDIEAVRTSITIRLTRAVEVHVATTDEDVAFVPPEAGIALVAVASEGEIQSDLSGVAVETQESLQRLRADLGGGGPTVSLRTTRGDIEILPPGTPAALER